jgi:Zn finger protein HypA/HybF involved in hydrogenase expression
MSWRWPVDLGCGEPGVGGVSGRDAPARGREGGVMAAVDVDALRFCFEIALRGSKWPLLKLDAETVPGEAHCLACGHRMRVDTTVLDCERCGSTQTVMHGSDELDLTCLEVERDQGRPAGAGALRCR